ncbi:hypothetical protein KSP39_PZI007661 [Platanthera zijinensis]|uniref:Uncharacterized protein n=1 Tax=Platanthera zijinensis TaxID=2320716 RepID=A0AAP0G8T8_9ASPA
MIQCACSKRVTSSVEISEGQGGSKSCWSCGGILSADELGGLSRRVWSAMGPEFSRAIDPQLKWKISANCKQRGIRKARTFTHDNGKNSTAMDLKDVEYLFDKQSKKEGDIPVSESEKLGVSLLGRRFSDNLENFPIKKRITSLLPSRSTPNLLASSGFHEHNQGGPCTLFQNSQVLRKQDDLGISPSHAVDLGHEKGSNEENRKLENIEELVCDSADFSGISILAAAACHSSIENGIHAEGPTVRQHSFEENSISSMCFESHRGMLLPSNPELGNDKSKSSAAYISPVKELCRAPRQLNSDEYREVHSCSLQSFPRKKNQVSSRGDRLNWDLNTVMDVWESQSDDYSNCDPHDSFNVKSNWRHDGDCGNQVALQAGPDFGINSVGLVVPDNQNISHSLCKLEEEIDEKHASPVEDCDKGKHDSTQTQVCESLQGKRQFKDAKFMVAISPERTNLEGDGNLVRYLSAKIPEVCEEDKCESDCVRSSVEVGTHNILPYPIVTGSGFTNYDFDPFTEVKKVNEMLHDENRSITTVDSCNNYSGECQTAYDRTGRRIWKNNQLLSPHVEKHQCIPIDVAGNVNATGSPAEQLDQNSRGMIIGGDGKKTIQVLFDESSSKSMTAEGCLFNASQLTSLLFNSHETSNELLPSKSVCISQHDDTCANVKVDDSNSYSLSGENVSLCNAASPQTNSPKLINSVTEEIMVDTKAIPSILISHGECRIPGDVHVDRSEKNSLELHFDYEEHSSDSPIDIDHAAGLEKVDLLGDDDSQYEDGELRESVLNSCGEDEVEEVETEHVDYGSDCREAESFEAESEFCSQSDLAVGTTDCKPEGKILSTCDGNRFWATEGSQSKFFQKHSTIKDYSNAIYAEGEVGGDILKDSGKVLDVNVASEVHARDEKRFISSNLPTDVGVVSGKAIQPSSSRMKSSGWDKLPKNEGMIGSAMKRDFASRVQISKSSEVSCRKEVSYARENRKHDQIVFNAERSTDARIRLDGRSIPFHSHGRGRVWVDPPDHHVNCRFDISGNYSSPKFPLPGSRNAAAAAVAKVESNGFVVAPDGTIVKCGSLGPGSHLSGQSSKSSTHFLSTRRGSSIDSDGDFHMLAEVSNSRNVSPGKCFNAGRGRDSRYGSRLFSPGHANRYHSPVLDSRIDSQSLQHSSSRRQHSFSPHRRPLHLAREHTRSPSRSRTRSPHTWTSPRGRSDPRISAIHNVKRQSRSPPNFKAQRRMPRQRSPQHRGFPAEDFSDYASVSRNYSSPSLASKWCNSERIFQDRLWEHDELRHPRERSPPPARSFSQRNRLEDMDSRIRMKPDEYYELNYSERFQEEYCGYGRGSKHDGSRDDRRGKSNRYEVLHPEGHLESNGNMSCLHYDGDISARNLRQKSSGFQPRRSPRSFDRSIDSQNVDSPRRIKGGMVPFRRGRDAKSNTDLKPFNVRDTSDDMPLQRRPS